MWSHALLPATRSVSFLERQASRERVRCAPRLDWIPRAASVRSRGIAAGLCLLLATAAPAENLLANPGFEELAGDKPSRWDQFVQPMPGATAVLTDAPHGGRYAIQLHIPTPYEKDPVNNWSQNIFGDFGGGTLKVSGFIRVEDAKEAAIWLQLWRKKPWGVLGAASTSIDMPVYGTQDWQEVSMEVPVPEGTDFVTLRCVLLGSGSAWFDDISVARVTEAPPESASPTPAAGQAVEPEASEAPAAPTPAVEPDAVPEAPPVLSQEKVLPLVNQLEAEVSRLRDANVILTDTLQQIQSVNQELLKEMLEVQAELQALKAEKEKAAAPALTPAKPRVPPLVPLSEAQEINAP